MKVEKNKKKFHFEIGENLEWAIIIVLLVLLAIFGK